MDRLIEAENLVKRYGPVTAVDGISFDVARGDVLGFLGPNGAGKSTTFRMITGFLTPTEGTMRVAGRDVCECPVFAKAQIGYLPEGAPAYPDMTPIAFLEFIARARGLYGRKRRKRLDYVIANVQLERVLEQRIESLSKGFKRRVVLAQAILHDPPILVLDEPTDGLDPNQKLEMRRFIQGIAAEKAVIISTHDLDEARSICSRVVIVNQGRILVDRPLDELLSADIPRLDDLYHRAILESAAPTPTFPQPLPPLRGVDRS